MSVTLDKKVWDKLLELLDGIISEIDLLEARCGFIEPETMNRIDKLKRKLEVLEVLTGSE